MIPVVVDHESNIAFSTEGNTLSSGPPISAPVSGSIPVSEQLGSASGQGLETLPTHTINEHLEGGLHILTYKALTCKYHHASQAGSSRSICAVTALNCVRLAFQLEAKKEGVEETIVQSFFSEEMMNVSVLFNFSCRGSLMIKI